VRAKGSFVLSSHSAFSFKWPVQFPAKPRSERKRKKRATISPRPHLLLAAVSSPSLPCRQPRILVQPLTWSPPRTPPAGLSSPAARGPPAPSYAASSTDAAGHSLPRTRPANSYPNAAGPSSLSNAGAPPTFELLAPSPVLHGL
jgi:hypothetical protein